MPVMEMLALITPRSRPSPRLDDKVMGFIEVLAVISWVGVVEKLLAPRTAYPPRDQAPAGNQVDLGEFLRHAQRVLDDWEGIPDQHDLRLLGKASKDGGFDIHYPTHTEGSTVMLVERNGVKSQFLGIARFVE